MKLINAIGAGLVGAVTVTAINEVARRVYQDAPRPDQLGMQVVANTFRKASQNVPDQSTQRKIALAGDLVANTAYYSLVGAGPANNTSWVRGGLLGLLAGLGGVLLPSTLGLAEEPTNRTRPTQILTVLYYLAGGLASALAYRLMGRGRGESRFPLQQD